MVFIAIGAVKAAKFAKKEIGKSNKRNAAIQRIDTSSITDREGVTSTAAVEWWGIEDIPEHHPATLPSASNSTARLQHPSNSRPSHLGSSVNSVDSNCSSSKSPSVLYPSEPNNFRSSLSLPLSKPIAPTVDVLPNTIDFSALDRTGLSVNPVQINTFRAGSANTSVPASYVAALQYVSATPPSAKGKPPNPVHETASTTPTKQTRSVTTHSNTDSVPQLRNKLPPTIPGSFESAMKERGLHARKIVTQPSLSRNLRPHSLLSTSAFANAETTKRTTSRPPSAPTNINADAVTSKANVTTAANATNQLHQPSAFKPGVYAKLRRSSSCATRPNAEPCHSQKTDLKPCQSVAPSGSDAKESQAACSSMSASGTMKKRRSGRRML